MTLSTSARRAISRLVASAIVAILVCAGILSDAASRPASAAAAAVTTHADLQSALTIGGTVVLGADISGGGVEIPNPNDVVLDLAGFTLTVQGAGAAGSAGGKAGIEVPVGASLTINGPGVLRANGGGGGAGIGGSHGQANGAITINGGTIEANGDYRSAGIGTGDSAPAGSELVTINGGTVTALGGYIGAALGSGASAVAPPITINGGTVRAGAALPYQGMGIGAGEQGIASTIRINSGDVWVAGRLWCGGTLGAWASDIGGVCIPNAPVDITIGATAVVNLLAAHDYDGVTSVVQFSRDGVGSFSNAGTLNVLNARLTFPAGSTASNSGTITGPVVGAVSGNNFVLSFNDAGGSGGPGSVRVLAATLSAAGMAVPAAPTRAGFTFAGWWSGETGGSQLATTTALSSSTWHARWQAPEHPITFDSTGGSPVASVAVAEGSTLALPAAPTKANYTFAGWFTAVSGGTEWTAATPVTGPTTLYAHWALTTYTVSFDTGTGGSAVPSQTVTHGATAAVPVDLPTRLGHTFGGWFTTAGGASVWNASTPVTSDTTVFALWTADTYTVSFDTGPGASTVSSKTVAHGSTVSLPAAPARSGYRFWGWVTTSGGTTEWSRTAPVTGPMTLYARWVINTYTVSFDSNDGTAVASQTVAHGDSAAVPTPPTRTGYSFAGWMTSAAGSTAWDATAAVTSDVTVYARWTVNSYTVTFDTGAGGSFEPSQTIVYGGRASVPSDAPIRSHHSFVGWFTAASGGSAWDGSAVVTGNVTVYARWLIDSYVVSFDAQGGSAVASQTIGHGQAATVPAVPTRAGYAFAGWFTTPTGGAEWADSAPVTAALTVYAAWDALVPTAVSVSIEDDLVAIPAGRSVTIFGTVTPTTAVGTIELFEDGVSIGSGAVVGGGYQINTFALAGGNYVYTAEFTPGEPRFVFSTSAPVDLVVNPLRPRVPAPATDTDGLLDEIDANGWPVHPLPGGLDSVLGKNVPWTNPLDSFADVYVYSTAQWLGTYAVVGGKVDSGYWAFMPTLTPGPHHLVFVGQTSRTVSVYEFSVPAPAVAALPPVTPVALASTGIEPAPWASLGLVLLLLGAGLVARRRVRSV
ncbi:InlB B-repeat-containing protein [Homoserinimonas hongtaonis]|uniref:InlB B-repeat-containing protein n=1 Tax=Homoserinimonas hongtaonis TaxID=2079791 RepID=UPI000D335816|nr:InlB B-repeat-containing protein [Salinibacterium hongtaonis]AWB90186.1 hypothetical protein C2138_12100 [Salinibacterium hongtaonis]